MPVRTIAAALSLALVAAALFTACQTTLERLRFHSLRMTAHNGPSNDQVYSPRCTTEGKECNRARLKPSTGTPRPPTRGTPSRKLALRLSTSPGKECPRTAPMGTYWLRKAAKRQHTDPEFLRLDPEMQSEVRRIIERIQILARHSQGATIGPRRRPGCTVNQTSAPTRPCFGPLPPNHHGGPRRAAAPHRRPGCANSSPVASEKVNGKGIGGFGRVPAAPTTGTAATPTAEASPPVQWPSSAGPGWHGRDRRSFR